MEAMLANAEETESSVGTGSLNMDIGEAESLTVHAWGCARRKSCCIPRVY